MVSLHNTKGHTERLGRLLDKMPLEDAVRAHVGKMDQYERIGAIERQILLRFGLKDGDSLVDVGCGSGRLAKSLQDMPNLDYLGTDVVELLIEYCRNNYRSDWRFEVVDGFTIPKPAKSVDMVAAFSVFTHILYEETFIYLEDCYRVLKDGGLVVFSFMDLSLPYMRKPFMNAVRGLNHRSDLMIYFGMDVIRLFSEEIGFTIEEVIAGNNPVVTLDSDITLGDGSVLKAGPHQLGQSLCVLRKPVTPV